MINPDLQFTEHQFLQNALQKMNNDDHLTYYEKAAIGKFYKQQLSVDEYDEIEAISIEQWPDELQKLNEVRSFGFESFKNDVRMDTPVALPLQMLIHYNIYIFVRKQS